MSTYAVGDIQGCLPDLLSLLDKVGFSDSDVLWAAGDLVNRGPESLATLRFIYNLGERARIVLGNHDLHLLACWHGTRKANRKDTFDEILAAPDAERLLEWLQRQALIHHDTDLGYAMVHAGIPPIWDLSTACTYAKEVETALRTRPRLFFEHMYGNEPSGWQEHLTDAERLRVITNYFTRMRFCDEQGNLEFTHKGSPNNKPVGYKPWFQHATHACNGQRIIFGHWAAAMGQTHSVDFIGLDTGCVWGEYLSMLRLDDGKRFVSDRSYD